MPRVTPLHSRVGPLCQGNRWEEWSGFLTATMYDLDHLHEYNAVRTGCGMFDVSPLLKYDIRGRDAAALLNRVIVRDATKCRIGQVIYTTWCDDDGKVIDDGTVSHLTDDHFRLTSAVPALHWLQENATGLEVDVEDTSEQIAAISIQGPTSRDLLQKLTKADLPSLGFFRCARSEVSGMPAWISRTGYTGDLGYEVFVDPTEVEKLWDSMMELAANYQMRPAGTLALDQTRVEAGLLLLDADFVSAAETVFDVQKTSPYDLGLGWMVNLKKDFFVGHRALRREKEHGSRWLTVGLELDVTALEKFYAEWGMPLQVPQRAWAEAVPVYANASQTKHIGRGTSGTWSPILKKYVVMARIKPEYAKLGTQIYIEEMIEAVSYSVPATVVKMPFYDPPRKKA
jgi:aminomethyltransferase